MASPASQVTELRSSHVHELMVLEEFVMNGKAYDVEIVWNGPQPLFRAKDIGAILNLKDVGSSLRSYDEDEVQVIVSNTAGGPQPQIFITTAGVRHLLAKSRKPAAASLAKAFGMVVHNNHYICVEAAALDFLQTSLKGLDMHLQFFVGQYFIDLYFPKARVAIECDENNAHGPGRVSNDLIRQRFVETKLHCTFVRFRPQQKDFKLAEFLNRVLQALHKL